MIRIADFILSVKYRLGLTIFDRHNHKMQFSKLQWLLNLTPPGTEDFSWKVM